MVSDFVVKLATATDLEKLWEMHLAKMAEYGIDRLFYGSTRYRTPNSLGDPEDFVVLTNHTRAFVDVFFGRKYYLHGSMVTWSLENFGAVSWRYMHERFANGEMTEKEIEVYEFNLANDIQTGYSISYMPTQKRQRSGLSLIARKGISQHDMDEMWQEHGKDIQAMCHVLHLKILTLPYSRSQRPLTKRQREVLEWVADGKTILDISILMGLKPATIEKHLRLARESLCVETTAQAILKASFQNQIFILKPPSDAK